MKKYVDWTHDYNCAVVPDECGMNDSISIYNVHTHKIIKSCIWNQEEYFTLFVEKKFGPI